MQKSQEADMGSEKQREKMRGTRCKMLLSFHGSCDLTHMKRLSNAKVIWCNIVLLRGGSPTWPLRVMPSMPPVAECSVETNTVSCKNKHSDRERSWHWY